MSISDYITIICSILATIAAIVVSWKFYQLQQSADLRTLSERILDLSRTIKMSTILEGKADDIATLATLRERIAKIDGQLNSAVESITQTIESHQQAFDISFQAKLTTHLNQAREEFEESVRRELKGRISEPGAREEIANDLVEVFVQATRTLPNVSAESRKESTEEFRTEVRIKRPLNEVRAVMEELRGLFNLPKLLTEGNSQETDDIKISGRFIDIELERIDES